MKLLIITQKVDKNDQLLGFFIPWIIRFAEKFEKIIILCLEKGEFNPPPNVIVVSMGKEKNNSKIIQGFNFYKYIIQNRHQYDSVFVHMNPIWVVLGGWYWRLAGKKIFFWYTHKAVTLKLKWATFWTDTIFSASEESFRWKTHSLINSSKLRIIGHGIDTELFKSDETKKIQDDKLRILSVGRLAPVKNYETLIDAVKILKDDNVDFSVTMVGETALEVDKQYELKIKNRIKEFGLESNFNFVGKVNHDNLPSYYQSHDVFVHLSKTGSLDKTILEAMSCGMFVLSSNYSTKALLYDQGEFLFDEDDANGLAFKLKLISNGAMRQDSLRNTVVLNHNLDRLINKISKIINA